MSRKKWFGQRDWAEAWARREPLIEHLVPPLLDVLRPVAGERMLDVGTGAGTVARALAPRLQPGGAMDAIDISDEVLRIARKLAGRSGVEVTFREADAQRNTALGAPYDAAVSLLGVMFFEDPVAAFANIRRQVRAGGRLAFTCWAEPDRNPLLAEQLLADFRAPGAWDDGAEVGGSFSLANPDTIRATLSRGGWADIAVRTHAYRAVVPARAVFDDALFALYRVPSERVAEARRHVQKRLDAFAVGEHQIAVPLVVNTCAARAPS